MCSRLSDEIEDRLKNLINTWDLHMSRVTPRLVANRTLLSERQALAVLKRLNPARYFGTRVEGGAT